MVCQGLSVFVVGRTDRGIFVALYNHSFHQPDLYLFVLTFFEPPRKPIEVIHIVNCF